MNDFPHTNIPTFCDNTNRPNNNNNNNTTMALFCKLDLSFIN